MTRCEEKRKRFVKKKVLPFFLQKGRKKFFFFLVMAYRQNDDFFAVPQEIKIYFVRLKTLNKRIYQRIYIFLLNNLFLLSSLLENRKPYISLKLLSLKNGCYFDDFYDSCYRSRCLSGCA